MNTAHQIEVEEKFSIDNNTTLPDLAAITRLAGPSQQIQHDLSALYYDTRDLRLSRARITLRYRHGGTDEGWTLKLPGMKGRTEIHSDAPHDHGIPEKLTYVIEAVTRGQSLQPVARVNNTRVETTLHDDTGTPLLEVCDDRVKSECFLPGGAPLRWREWEVELSQEALQRPEPMKLLRSASEALIAAGAQPSPSPSKLKTALGRGFDSAPTPPLPVELDPKSPLYSQWSQLIQHRDEVLAHDRRIRLGYKDDLRPLGAVLRVLLAHLQDLEGYVDQTQIKSLSAQLSIFADLTDRSADLLQEGSTKASSFAGSTAITSENASDTPFERGLAHTPLASYLSSEEYWSMLDNLDELLSQPPYEEIA
ncbi:CYTH domain-containing protein [Corynebacterium sp. ES2794-CONJ1]|uniref:CYTH domain-containing protein n=1 Tax=Corynebacterium sp. ES2794-CONJ1 TaxID=2980553 RepID=UPI0021DB42AB|nr:CYTH domain-containing protein [Corynebacterium sp. ES2794-CONJ1]MCU9519806.1 CYTH domain-containing protein [Corynebacterium sp. ES2794-CONJ1]